MKKNFAQKILVAVGRNWNIVLLLIICVFSLKLIISVRGYTSFFLKCGTYTRIDWLLIEKTEEKEEIVFALLNYEEKTTKQKQQRLRKQIAERVSKSHLEAISIWVRTVCMPQCLWGSVIACFFLLLLNWHY